MLKATPSRKVPQTPAPATSKRGRNGEERAAFLRVGTGQKALRAVGQRFFFKLWDSEGKINRPEHTAGGSQNKGTEKLQRRATPSPLEVGGRGRGKGQTQPQRSHPSHTANRPRVLSKDFLRPDWWRALGPWREKARCARGVCAKPLAARPEHGESSPHTATSACRAPPSPQQDSTELANLNKRSPLPTCVRAEVRQQTEAK